MIQELSSYSTERYYLLSELEQKYRMKFLDEAPSPTVKKDDQTSKGEVTSTLTIAYKLWIYDSCPILELLTSIAILLDSIQKPADSLTLCVVIDLLLSPGKKLEGDLYVEVKSLLSHELFKSYWDCLLVIGAFDNVAACPGLEFCFHCIEQISPGYSSDDMVGLLIAQSRSEMLGAEPDREPDAVNEVYQAYCTREVDSIENFFKRLSNEFGKKNKASHKIVSKERGFSIFPPIVLIALLFALIFAFFPTLVGGDLKNWSLFR